MITRILCHLKLASVPPPIAPARRHQELYLYPHSPFFLDFLQGKRDYQCTPWGNPNYSVLGWQKPCYLMADGYTEAFQELMDKTPWDNYGTGRDPRCADCMVHCGYEASAVMDTVSHPMKALQPALSVLS